MNFKVYQFLMTLGIVRSDILSPETVDHDFNTFVQNLLLKQFNSSRFIGILHDNKGIRDINLQLLGSFLAPVIIHDLFKTEITLNSTRVWIPNPTKTAAKHNLIIIEDYKNLPAMLRVAFSIPFFSARTNTLIIFTEKVSGTETWIREIFSELWKMYILNVGLIFHNGRVNLFTYIPWTSPHEIQNLTDQGMSANIFYDKLKNLHKYPIKILQNIYDKNPELRDKNISTTYIGVDEMTLSTILERYNATSNVIVWKPSDIFVPCRFIHYNYTIQGLFGADIQNESIDICPFSLRLPTSAKRPTELLVLEQQSDVILKSRPLRFDMDYRVDTSYIQKRDSYCILVPASKKISQIVNLIMPLQGYVWLGIFLNFIIYTAIYFGIKTFNETNEKGFFHSCLMLYRIQVINISVNPKKLRASENLYLLYWVLYSFLISTAYQSVLISFIIVPLYNAPLNRLEDLKQTDLPILVQADILIDIVNVLDKEISEIILPKMVLDIWHGPRIYNVKNGYFIPKSHAKHLLQQQDLMDKDGRPLFHLMDECPMPLLTSYQMPRGSFLWSMINKLTTDRKESGLECVWEENAERYLNIQVRSQEVPQEDGERHVRLTIAHLQGAFYVLFIGEVIGISAFLFEIFWKRKKRFM